MDNNVLVHDDVLVTWPLQQFNRLAQHHPDRMAPYLRTLFESHPELLSHLAVGAIDQEQVSLDDATRVTGKSADELEQQLIEYRNSVVAQGDLIERELHGIACVAGKPIAVWEIVRQHRKHSSIDQLTVDFPVLTRSEISAALRFAASHGQEMDDLIQAYEQRQERRRAEYPFSG